MDDQLTIGARLRVLRRWRHMTLAEVAGLAGVTAAWLSMVERGLRPLDRRSHVAAIASALRVSETDLVGGPHLSADPMQADAHTRIPPLRLALQTSSITEPSVDRARPLVELVKEVRTVESMQWACDFAALGSLLPDLIEELNLLVHDAMDEKARRVALEMLVRACTGAVALAKNLGYQDLAYVAGMRAAQAADVLDDPIQRGKAAFETLLIGPRSGSHDGVTAWERVGIAAERVVNDLEPHAVTPTGISVLGMLTLTTALTSAAATRYDAAKDWLGHADELAARVPDDPERNWQAFSATNVNIWRTAIGVEAGETGGFALKVAENIDEGKLHTRTWRKAAWCADVGRALAREKKTHQDAIRWLRRAEDLAPQLVRNSASIRDTVAVLLARSRVDAGGRELRGMAARMGIPH